MRVTYDTDENVNPWIDLGVAVCEQACQDYMLARYARLRTPSYGSNNISGREHECLTFFCNEDHPCRAALNIDTFALVAALNQTVDKAVEEGKPPYMSRLKADIARQRRAEAEMEDYEE